MQDPKNIKQYNDFEEVIKLFRQKPTNYESTVRNRLLRQLQNALPTLIIWLIVAAIFNIIGYIYLSYSSDKMETSSLLAIAALFLTIGARSYTVNYIMFDTIGRLGKFYTLHQLADRIGFFHRFMAISTLFWIFVYFGYKDVHAPFIDDIMVIIVFILTAVIILSALAVFRRSNHNIFENIHRYIGYITVALLTVYFFTVNIQYGLTFEDILIKPHLYLLLGIIAMLIAPWIGVKEVNPKLVHVGPHVVGIQLEGKPSFGTFTRITLANRNFHPFGDSMIDFNDTNNRVLYMTPAGDRTKEIIEAAQSGKHLLKECTVKKDRYKGFMYHHAVYDHILIVVTGGGIAPIIPCLVLNQKTKIDVLWIGRDQEIEFTADLLKSLLAKIDNQEIGIHILNTNDSDLKSFTNNTYIDLALKACEHYKPEVVFVMSNQKFTIDMMHALRKNDIKSYGATFDS